MTTPVTVYWEEWTGSTWIARATEPLDSTAATEYLGFLHAQQMCPVRNATTS